MTTEQRVIDLNQSESRRGLIRRMFDDMRQYNVIAEEIRGRMLLVGADHWVTDFASCNYLGLDLDAEMDSSVQDAIRRWGVHPSWCRLVASPRIYDDVERELAALVGTETALVLPTVTLISVGVIPALVGKSGAMFLDKAGHETMYEGCKIARDNGAALASFRHGDLAALRDLLVLHRANPRKLILVDGVYSMTGNYARLREIQQLAIEFDALVYIDDAHGFGVVGERPDADNPYGHRGNGIVRHLGLSNQNLLYVGGCSKAYSSLAAFIACSSEMRTFLRGFASPYDLSGPCPTASLATLSKGLDISARRGDPMRRRLAALSRRTIDGLREMGHTVDNETGFPIISVRAGADIVAQANLLFECGILVTVCPYPMVAAGEEVLRITLTAANTDQQIDHLLSTFGRFAPSSAKAS